MKQKTAIERRKARILKVQRNLIRLKYSLMADEELDNVLPETEAQFDKMVAKGDLPLLSATLNDLLGKQ